MQEKNEIQVYQPRAVSAFADIQAFEGAQRMAKALAESALVPDVYRGNIANCLVALEVAQRCQASPLMVMQNLYMIEGRPSWASSYIIAAINSSGRFSPLRFEIEERGKKTLDYEYWDGPKGQRQKKQGKITIDDRACMAWTNDRAGEVLEGPWVSFETAVREGWYTRSGSKWQTMPDLMLRYRAAAFFGRLYAPEILMGMRSEDEERDVIDVTPTTVETKPSEAAAAINEKIRQRRMKKDPGVSTTPDSGLSTPTGEGATQPAPSTATPEGGHF